MVEGLKEGGSVERIDCMVELLVPSRCAARSVHPSSARGRYIFIYNQLSESALSRGSLPDRDIMAAPIIANNVNKNIWVV